MKCIDQMVFEHENVMRLVAAMRSMCCFVISKSGSLEGEQFLDDFRKGIFVARNYADGFHHGKEEAILFKEMTENLGPAAEKVIRNGMLVEHDLGRLYISNLEAALDEYLENPGLRTELKIITNASAWADLLERHIEKENKVVYQFAARSFSEEKMVEIYEAMKVFDEEDEHYQLKEEALELLQEIEEKYCIEPWLC